MELVTPHMLWKDYDYTIEQLCPTQLNEEKNENFTVKSYYFNGEKGADGCTRIYARLYSPVNSNGVSVVLMNDVKSPFDMEYIDLLLCGGYKVLAVDYAGERESGKYTIYSSEFEYANYGDGIAGEKSVNPKKTYWYVYACVMMRACYFLQSNAETEYDKICIFGVRTGAEQVYKCATLLENIVTCAVAIGCSASLIEINGETDEGFMFKSCLDSKAYAPFLTIPTYIIEGSNSADDSLFSVADTFSATNDCGYFMIAERANETLSLEQKRSILRFINAKCNGEKTPSSPVIDAKNEEKKLVYDVTTDKIGSVKNIKLMYSYSDMGGEYRNFSSLPLHRVNEYEYSASADVYMAKREAAAFVNVKYSDGLILSSPVITKTPYLMGIKEVDVIKTRLIYDTDMGIDDWMINGKGYGGELEVVLGGNEIPGITSSVNSLTTLKIGDVHTCGERDSLLQLLVYSYSGQKLTFKVVCYDDDSYDEYVFIGDEIGCDEWTKITLSADDFRSESGVMDGFDKAISFTVESEGKLLVNSLLWI